MIIYASSMIIDYVIMLCIISLRVDEIEDSAQLNALHSTESIKDFSVASL